MGETFCQKLLSNHQASYLDPDKTTVTLLNNWLQSKNKVKIEAALRRINGNNLLKCNPKFVPSLVAAIQHFSKVDFHFSIVLWGYLKRFKALGVKVTPAQEEKINKLFPWGNAKVTLKDGKAYITGKGTKLGSGLVLDSGTVVFSKNGYFSTGNTIVNGILIHEANVRITSNNSTLKGLYIIIDIPNKIVWTNTKITFTKGNPIVRINTEPPLTISNHGGIKIRGGLPSTSIEPESTDYSTDIINGKLDMDIIIGDSSYSVKLQGPPPSKRDLPIIPLTIKMKERKGKPALLEEHFEYMPRRCNTINVSKRGKISYVYAEPKIKKADYFKQYHPKIKLAGQTLSAAKLIQLVYALSNIDPRIKRRINKITIAENIKQVCKSDNAAACIKAQVKETVDHKGRVLSRTIARQDIFLSPRFGLFAFYHEVGHAIANVLNLAGNAFTKDWVRATGKIHGRVAKIVNGKIVWIDNPRRNPSRGAHGCVRGYSCLTASEDWADFYAKSMTHPKFYSGFKAPKHKARLDVARKWKIFKPQQLKVIVSGQKPPWVAGYNVNEDLSLEDMLQRLSKFR